MNKDDIQTSKFLSLILRHRPDSVGISLDLEGWVDVDVLLVACMKAGRSISKKDLERIVEASDKKRFVIRDGRIRANQGHSVEVDLKLEPVEPPDVLYHGTATRFLDAILREGLTSQSRQHVHLSATVDTATIVGRRHGKPVVLEVAAGEMFREGKFFFLSENGVWLTESVEPRFLRETS